ncbi:DUF819 family protein [Elongatibacter sediminis]|uniref:DUF819 family protein n=1 Tax=Elongatibacter sediminis TaxID=3119006 RepID=A0AAW9R9E9_9GAMM
MPLISAENVFGLGTALFALAYLGFWIDQHPIGRKTSGVVWVLVGGMVLSHFKLIPYEAPVYDFVGGYMVSLAIPLLLFKADIRKIIRESGKVIITFMVASAATVIAAVGGFLLMGFGEVGAKVAGTYTAGYVGGAMNFLAVSQVVEMSKTEFASALSASSFVSILALLMLITLPSIRLVVRFLPLASHDGDNATDDAGQPAHQRPRLSLRHLTGAIALSFGICTIASTIGEAIGHPQYNILFVTVLTIVVANLFPRAMDALQGEFEMGMILMYLFFAMVGSSTNFTEFAGPALRYFIYGMFIIIVHLGIVLGVARLMKVDLAEAIVASGAALVGPAVTAAIAISQGWRSLVTPAIMVGVFGYVIGTFIGVAVATFLA